MGYFSREDSVKEIEKEPKLCKPLPTKESLIKEICSIDLTKTKEDLEKLDLEELKVLKKKVDLEQEKAYFKMYGKKTRERLYEYEDEEIEETEGFSR